jgi:hypothetical protein
VGALCLCIKVGYKIDNPAPFPAVFARPKPRMDAAVTTPSVPSHPAEKRAALRRCERLVLAYFSYLYCLFRMRGFSKEYLFLPARTPAVLWVALRTRSLLKGWFWERKFVFLMVPARRQNCRMHLLFLGLLAACANVGSAAAGDPSQTMVVRLLTPIASYSPAGTRFEAKVIGPESRRGVDFLPHGSIVSGKLYKTASVRLGLSRERALLEMQFDGCKLPDGTTIGCEVSLEGVDNARERVTENRIDGVLAASHPYGWLSGFWYHPGISMIPRSTIVLSGAGGVIYTHMAPTPWGAAIVLASRMVLFRMPDPEIELPAGTDLLARVRVQGSFVPSSELRAPLRPELAQWVAGQPEDVYLPDKRLAGDLIHLVFVGSREQVEHAFQAAGWTTSDPLTRRSFARMYSAYLAMKADPNAPVVPLTYRGNTAALTFQKTYNTVAKRHHIRIWPASFAGTQLWLAAATHDVAITLDTRRMSLTHRIDPTIDRERTTVVNDLSNAGCVAENGLVERPQAIRTPEIGKPSVTDGNAVVLVLGECSGSQPPSPDLPKPEHYRATLAMRRFILEDRQYLLRDNAVYWVYRAGCTLWAKKPQAEGRL